MSNVTELAELEGMIGDNELTDDEAEQLRGAVADGTTPQDALEVILEAREPSPADEPQPAAEPELTEKEVERRFGQARSIVERTHRKLRETMGSLLDGFTECEACSGSGLVPPGPTPRTHAYFKACETCAGFGQVLTGSRAQGHEARDCPTCKGRGYVEAMRDGQPLAPQPGMPDLTPPPPPAPSSTTATGEQANGSEPEPTFGTPAWMGDPSVGR